MSKIKKAFQAVIEIVKNPWLLNHIIDTNSVWQKKVEKKYNMPNGLQTINLSDLFPNFNETLDSFSFLGGGSLPTDIALLKSLCRRKEDTSYFEIGTWRGESVRNVSDVAKECYTLNLTKQQILDIGGSEEYADAHAFFSKPLKNVTHLEGDSRYFNYKGLNKKFDVIFIDGNHHHEFVVSDTKKVFEHLMHDSSVVVWHDYAYDPENVRFEILHSILDALPSKEHKNLYHVQNTMCAIYIKGDFPSKPLNPNTNPEKTFEISLTQKNI